MILPRAILPFFALCLASAGYLFAQQQEDADSMHAPDGGVTNHVDGVFIPAIAKTPFQAKLDLNWTHKLEDGVVISRKFHSIIARDNSGRVYEEDRILIPAVSNDEPPLRSSIISDPTTQTRTTCVTASHTCHIVTFHPATAFRPLPTGASANGNRFLQREELGKSTIDSLDVTGTKETLTINTEVYGNDRPLITTKEFWYSPQLQINLSVVRFDPRGGTQTLKVTDLNMSEPDAKLFETPSGYRTIDERSSPK